MKMESNDELKEIDFKNWTCYYFHHIIKLEDLHFDNILIDGKLYENILVYDTLYKTFIGIKPFSIRFNKVDRFIIVYDRFRYLVLFGFE